MEKRNLFPGALVIALVFAFVLGSCNFTIGGNNDTFVAVRNITGVPTATVAGTPLALTGTVTPSNATNKTIIWTLKDPGTTDASISGNILTAAAVGTVTVTATVINGLTDSSPYTQDFAVGVGSGFVPVTGIAGVPTIALVNNPLTLSGTAEPSNATNKTIVWSVENAGTTGAVITGNSLTTTAAGTVTVTATIANGLLGSVPYTGSFSIVSHDAGSSASNLFGIDVAPYYVWAMDDMGGYVYDVYVTIQNATWVATAEGTTFNSGSYNWIAGTRAAQWTVAGGGYAGDTGLALVLPNGKMLVANFANEYSHMNGTFTQLDTSLPLDGTWITSEPYYGSYVQIVASSSGIFKEYVSHNGSFSGEEVEVVRGTYTSTNPAHCTITHVNPFMFGGPDDWLIWDDDLDSVYKNSVGGSETFMVIVYLDKCETMGLTFQGP